MGWATSTSKTKSPVISTVHHHFRTHFIEATSQSSSNAILEHLLFVGASCVGVVGRKDSELFIVVPLVNDLVHRVANPIGGNSGAKFVQHQNIGLINRGKN